MKNPPTSSKIISPIKMSPLSKTLLVTEVERSSQWKILSPMIISPLLLKVSSYGAFQIFWRLLIFISLNQSEKQQNLILCYISSHIIFPYYLIYKRQHI